jgi:hypothetical protein
MMKFTESKDYSSTKIKAEAKNWTTETIIAALAEILGAENVGMVRTGTSTSQKNEIGAVIGTVEVNGAEVPVAVTINVTAKPYTDAPATAKRQYDAFDFAAARQTYNDYVADKKAKDAEKAQAKATKITADKKARENTEE